ncbi:TonB-dependent receptor [Gilvimarinus agarilyticus]|uniref:TonB-dependent receptor domain-containing protein n=1 Tax=Gilvimarinus sp. 2_MG-2023 TaxID=3062666 RepID=UPI001C07EF5C|nr:TonB-dependent receptor [Gilvimarinus sp. 2_MG-2023]MBU2887434.1 TonB-dependent receptor [Gilvimarinus agarilyticus]MDO6572093.1 TonB-dependent receptor [Gilvimarinus sp. 2_MG-2023]
MITVGKKRILAAFIAALSGVSASTLANDSELGTIETVTVVGQATNFEVTSEQLESYQANDLSDVFRLTPSVNVGGSLGIAQKIYVRGLEDNYVNVTVDGAPQASTLFHHIGRVSIDPNLLKQVDVQAGAGEASSGAGTIGGAIRFKTKSVDDLLASDESFGGKLSASHFTNAGEQYNVSLYGRLTDDWGLLGYYNDTSRDNFEDGNGDDVLGTASDQNMGFVKLSGAIGSNQNLSLSYETREEEAMFSSRPNWHVQPDELLYPSKAERDTVVANYALHQGPALNLEATLYDTVSSFKGGRFDWYTEIATFGFDLRNTTEIGDHRLTYGVDYRDDQVDSGDPLYAQEKGEVLGAYVQAYSQVTDQLLLSYGVRYDNYEFQQQVLAGAAGEPGEFEDSDVSFNAGLLYEVTQHWALGLSYAEAFRGKEIGDGFTIETPEAAGSPFAEDIVGETVSNVEASVEYTGSNLNAKLAIFDSEIENAMFDQLYGGPFYDNAGTVNTSGVEFDLGYVLGDFYAHMGYSNVDSEFDPKAGFYTQDFGTIHLSAYEFRHLGNSRGDTWNLGLEYSPVESFKAGFNIGYVDDLTIGTLYQDFDAGWLPSLYELEKEGYTTVDLFAEWEVVNGLSLNAAIINVFDEHYRDHSSVGDYSAVEGYGLVVGPWEAGRDIRLSVNYSF